MKAIKGKQERIASLQAWQAELTQQTPLITARLRTTIPQDAIQPNELLTEVIRFLYLVATSKQSLTPSLLVDLSWHEFILFTKAYHHFCTTNLGRFIHHTPDNNTVQNKQRYLKTIQLYITTFGCPPEQIWGQEATQEWNESQCGACSTN